MKYTLLEMVQRILESMDSDEVDAYGDTIESLAVANIIKESYYDLCTRLDLPRIHAPFQLTASGDNTKPVLMTVPEAVLDIDWIKYNEPDASSNSQFNMLTFLEWPDFLEMSLGLKESDSNVSTMTQAFDGTNFTFKFYTDRYPSFYSTPDDEYVIFDAHKATVDDTLRASKTLCYGRKAPTFTMSDNFTPKLEADQFQLLLQTAKELAFVELKQTQNAHAKMQKSKHWQATQKRKNNVPNRQPGRYRYGRRPA